VGASTCAPAAAVVPPATDPVEIFPVRVSSDGWVEIGLTGSLAS